MREVEPKVFLIARPQIDTFGMAAYLDEVGGSDWLYRRSDAVESSPGSSLVEFMGRLCYRSWEPGLNPNVTRVRGDQDEYLANVLNSGHGSVLEHANYSFVILHGSRVFTHEAVRHRAGTAISQESMRFVRLTDIPFWMPPWFQQEEYREERDRAVRLLTEMEMFQTELAQRFGLDDPDVPFSEKKAKTSFMRRFAPDGVATSMGWTANIRALRWIIQQRTEIHAEEEIRIVFDQIAEIMQREEPALFQDFEVTAEGAWVPSHRKV